MTAPAASGVRLEPLSPQNERAVLEYLSQNPYVNVFVTYLVLFDVSATTRQKISIAYDGDRVCGAAFFGRQLALACDPVALDAFAERARRHRGERMIIGSREAVAPFWQRVRDWHQRPRLLRDRQLVMAVDRARLRLTGGNVQVRRAKPEDWTDVAASSAELIEQELAYDPRRAAADFGANVREMIERKLWWVGEHERKLCFFCNVGPWCRSTAQLQGIWAPPEFRGRGLATEAFTAICDRLLEYSPTLSLYVNDFNRDAIALYTRAGFEHVADFQTILF
ncbi:MAG: GNAT family N-acetyltransferase [Candidatus Eremiobacteraeota bacterium]|nr:GNAT family N-acetyltransferase [Candidatus Eremiobacteraeota bacterium]MBV8722301.1 GNAT family N-acetyltransferase [Candidatus Eremiobacteraeota bacterium]